MKLDSATNEKRMADLISKDQLKLVFATAKQENIDKYFAPLNAALAHYSINSPLRICHFIAQVAQESGCFRYNEEIWPNPTLDANGVATKGSSWQLRYEGNTGLGNTHPGDGYRFRGRGLIQLTGRANYEWFAQLANEPDGWEAEYAGGAMAMVAHAAYHLGEIRQGIGIIRSR